MARRSTRPPRSTQLHSSGNVGTYAGQPGFLGQAGFLSPGSVTGWARQFKPPTVYQYGLSVQHQLARNTILDLAYVGNMGRFLPESKALNTLPYGTASSWRRIPILLAGSPFADTLTARSFRIPATTG